MTAAKVARSSDRHWQVTRISLDGQPLLRIEHDTPYVPGVGVPLQNQPGSNRWGPQYTAFGILVSDIASELTPAGYLKTIGLAVKRAK
jgi:hypothetical protein